MLLVLLKVKSVLESNLLKCRIFYETFPIIKTCLVWKKMPVSFVGVPHLDILNLYSVPSHLALPSIVDYGCY